MKKIYKFLVRNVITEVYCNNYFVAIDSLVLINNCEDQDIKFIGYEDTCDPLMQWEINLSEITF